MTVWDKLREFKIFVDRGTYKWAHRYVWSLQKDGSLTRFLPREERGPRSMRLAREIVRRRKKIKQLGQEFHVVLRDPGQPLDYRYSNLLVVSRYRARPRKAKAKATDK